MTKNALRILPILMLALGTGAMAQVPKHMTFSGALSDYTAADGTSGPWEVRGTWTMTVRGNSGKADFSAALNMVRSDLGVMQNGGGDLNNPTNRNAHTHHITVLDATVTAMSTGGFQVTGPATITSNGAYPAPFGGDSNVVITITGGNSVTYSNIAMTLQGDAVKHFGTTDLHGVIRSAKGSE